MSLLPILKYPHKTLAAKTKKIKDSLAPEIQKLIAEMIETMKSAKGAGLAANQVGYSLRLCVIEENGNVFVMINPVITSCSRKKVAMDEGCLSFPGKFISLCRPEKIKVRYLDEKGKKVKIKSDGLLARIIQHEIDHLNGIVITDRLKK